MWYHELKIQLFLRYRELTQYTELPFSEGPLKYIFPIGRSQRTFKYKYSCQHVLMSRNYCTGAHGYAARRLSHKFSL